MTVSNPVSSKVVLCCVGLTWLVLSALIIPRMQRQQETKDPATANIGLPVEAVLLVEDGAWTWFNDQRALFNKGLLYFGYVRSATRKPTISVWDPVSKTATQVVEFNISEFDDHNNPGMSVLPDGRFFAGATHHEAQSASFSYVTSLKASPRLAADWSKEKTQSTPSRFTYMNPMALSKEKQTLYVFTRGINWNPSFFQSEDFGTTWSSAKQLIQTGKGRVRPYVKYASNGKDRIDILYTDGHPSATKNSVYHLYFQADPIGTPGGGTFHQSDGTPLKRLSDLPIRHDDGERGTVVYKFSGDPSNDPNSCMKDGRAWVWDVVNTDEGSPVAAFQIAMQTQPPSSWLEQALKQLAGAEEFRSSRRIYYYYARWNGKKWDRHLIAQGGCPLYAKELNYGGGIAIDPEDPNVVYISSNATTPFALNDLQTSSLNKNFRFEIYRGITRNGGATFSWTPLTKNSTEDNIRPYVPAGHSKATAVMWLRGSYRSYKKFNTGIVGLFSDKVSNY